MRFAAGSKISNFLSDGPDFGAIGSSGVMNEAAGDANTALNNARTAGMKMRSIAEIESAKNMAEATRATGQAQGQASMVSGIAGAVGGLGGLIGSSFGGGGGGSYGGSNFSSSFGAFSTGASFNVPSTFNAPSWR